jgi:hypothetical protein
MAKVFARKYMRNGLPKEKLEEKPWQLSIFISADNREANPSNRLVNRSAR